MIIRCLVACQLLLAGLLLAPAPAADAATITLDGVSVRLRDGTRQVVTVNHTSGTYARVTLWRKKAGHWSRIERATGRTGYGGLVAGDRREQGTGTTPLGTYRLLSSFGTHAKLSYWDLSYRKIRTGDFWVQDNQSRYYNRYRNRSQGGFRWWLASSNVNSSERLKDYPRQYEYSIVTSYNYAAQVRYRGSGIFLHVNGSGATAGCVSAPRWFLRTLMAKLDPHLVPLIAIGR